MLLIQSELLLLRCLKQARTLVMLQGSLVYSATTTMFARIFNRCKSKLFKPKNKNKSKSKSCHTKDALRYDTLAESVKPLASKIEKGWTNSKLKIIQLEHIWTIEHFSHYVHAKRSLATRINSAPIGGEEPAFELQIRPKDSYVVDKSSKGYVSLYLWCLPKAGSEVLVNCQVSIIDMDGKERCIKEKNAKFTRSTSLGWKRFIKRSALMNLKKRLLDNDQLQIHCKVTASYDRVDTSTIFGRQLSTTPDEQRKDWLWKIKDQLATEAYADVDLIVDRYKYAGHRIILSAQSPVFADLFDDADADVDASTGRLTITIDDVTVENFQLLLEYIYNDKIDDEKLTAELLTAADKYKVDGLKKACEDHLSLCLSTDSVASVLLLANNIGATRLKENCIHFIATNINKVMVTEDWQSVAAKYPRLVGDVCRQLALMTGQAQAVSPKKGFDDDYFPSWDTMCYY